MSFILWIIAPLIFILAFLPVFRQLFDIWTSSEEYSHAILIIPIIVYMIWEKKSALNNGTTKYALSGLIIAIISIIFYQFAMLTQVRTFIFLSMYLTIIGSSIYIAGAGVLSTLATPLLLFLMLIPIPEQLYPQLTFPLQLKVSQASEIIVKSFGIPLLREGNIIHLPQKSFEVVEACSGLRSAISLLTLSVIIGYFMLNRLKTKAFLFAASIPIAIFVNIVRVVSMILLFYFFNVDLTEGKLHTLTGLLVFTLAIVVFLVINKLLVRWELNTK